MNEIDPTLEMAASLDTVIDEAIALIGEGSG